jgi:hypothetical protein
MSLLYAMANPWPNHVVVPDGGRPTHAQDPRVAKAHEAYVAFEEAQGGWAGVDVLMMMCWLCASACLVFLTPCSLRLLVSVV